MFSSLENFDDESINHLILLVNPIEIGRKVQGKSACDFIFQGIIWSAIIDALPRCRSTSSPTDS
jgi:hypothetical protein